MNLEPIVLKYDKDGTNHINVQGEVWPVTSINFASSDCGNDITIDEDHVYIAGYWTSVNNGKDVLIARFDKDDGSVDGTPYTWDDSSNHGDDCANSIVIDDSNFYIGGYSYDGANDLETLVQKRTSWNVPPSWSASSYENPGDDMINSIIIYEGYVYAGGSYDSGASELDALMLQIDPSDGFQEDGNSWGSTYTDGIKSVQPKYGGGGLSTVGWSYGYQFNDDGSMDTLMQNWELDLDFLAAMMWG